MADSNYTTRLIWDSGLTVIVCRMCGAEAESGAIIKCAAWCPFKTAIRRAIKMRSEMRTITTPGVVEADALLIDA